MVSGAAVRVDGSSALRVDVGLMQRLFEVRDVSGLLGNGVRARD